MEMPKFAKLTIDKLPESVLVQIPDFPECTILADRKFYKDTKREAYVIPQITDYDTLCAIAITYGVQKAYAMHNYESYIIRKRVDNVFEFHIRSSTLPIEPCFHERGRNENGEPNVCTVVNCSFGHKLTLSSKRMFTLGKDTRWFKHEFPEIVDIESIMCDFTEDIGEWTQN